MNPHKITSVAYWGTVKSANTQGPAAPSTIRYVLTVSTENGDLDLGPCVAYPRQFGSDEVVAWPVGTPLAFGVVAGQYVGLFVEPPAIGDCPP